ncbi:MAG: FecR family protein [Desulfobacterales bacterium]|nr:FecR family protein [Desulfobacterales bacterium]
MKKAWLTIISLLILLPGTADRVFSETHAAMVKSTSGQVSILRRDQSVPARVGMLLLNGDTIVSAHKGYAGIMFTDGTVITLGPETDFRINTYVFSPETGNYDFFFYLDKGSAVYHSGKISKLSPESVKVATPKATVGIRGTRFIIKVD